MLIYSIIPDEIIFSQEASVKDELQDIMIEDGTILQMDHRQEELYEIVRIISTDPAKYLKTVYSPGTVLHIVKNKDRD